MISRSRWSCRVTLREMTVCGELCGEGSPASVRQAPSSVPLVCNASPSLLRAHDVLHCPFHILHIPHHSRHLSPDSLSAPFLSSPSETYRLQFGDSNLHTRLILTRLIQDTSPSPFKSLHTTLTRTLNIPLLSLYLLFYYGPFIPRLPPLMLFFPHSPTCPLVIYYSSDANGPHTKRGLSSTPTHVE